jgi:thiol-disulfide isomerase/thioredoxin
MAPLLRRMALAGALLAVCSGRARGFAAEPLLHRQAPEFVRRDLQRRRVDLHAIRGKVVLLNFWATWCAPCELEIPRFVQWQSTYGAAGLEVIGISMDDDPRLARKLYAKLGVNYPVAMGDEKIGELFGGVLGLPVTFLIDRRGEIQAVYRGETDLDGVEKQMKQLLAQR